MFVGIGCDSQTFVSFPACSLSNGLLRPRAFFERSRMSWEPGCGERYRSPTAISAAIFEEFLDELAALGLPNTGGDVESVIETGQLAAANRGADRS